MSFASNKFSREIRLEAALFIGSMCRTSLLTVSRLMELRVAERELIRDGGSSFKCSSAVEG